MSKQWTIAEYETHYSVKHRDTTIVSTPDITDIDKSNVNYIRQACNAYPALVKTLEHCLGYFDEQFPNMAFGIPQEVREALSKCK